MKTQPPSLYEKWRRNPPLSPILRVFQVNSMMVFGLGLGIGEWLEEGPGQGQG